MRDASSSTPAAGGPGRSRRPGFSCEVRLVGGEAGRRLEREQAEAIAEVLRWVAANPAPVPAAAVGAAPQAGSGPAGPAPGEVLPQPGEVDWPYPLQTRAHAVGLVGVGRPVREVARLVGVHPGTVARWVRQAVRRWADQVDMVKLQQKISGCWRPLDGAQAFLTVRSYIATARKQDRNPLDALRRLFDGHPWLPLPAAG